MYKIFLLIAVSISLFNSHLKAVEGSVFLNTVNPLQSVDGLPPLTGANDADSVIYQSYRSSVVDPFLSTHLNPVIQVFEPPPGDLVDNIPIAKGNQVRAYFVSEEAAFSNQFGFIEDGNFDLTSPANANSLIFERIESLADPSGPPNDVIKANDYTEIYSAASSNRVLDFFLIANGANALPNDDFAEHIFFTDETQNLLSEEKVLIVELPSTEDYSYYFIAAEDLMIDNNENVEGSLDPGDYPVDFADFFAVIQVKTPEPSVYLVLGSFIALFLWKKYSLKKV